jgi:putative hydrolase of the HAD superfamily
VPPTYDALLVDDLGVLSATLDGSLVPTVLRVRSAGLLTAVVSNADGPARDGLRGLGRAFLSGELGLRKPDPAFYLLVADRLGVAPARCVVVDDVAANVRGAVAAGMTGVRHRSLASTVAELEVLLGLPLT